MTTPRQLALLEEPPVAPDPGHGLGARYGEVFTRRWVVELILDLVGYTPDRDLSNQVLVEPSCGTGAFLIPVVERLIESSNRINQDITSLGAAIRAYDLLDANAELARKAILVRLLEHGLTHDQAYHLVRPWVTTGDFLLQPERPAVADYVVGNPPYLRLEDVSTATMDAYRRRCSTMRGRSDIYIGFLERGLSLLRPGGALSYICADRWMRNQYGAGLRGLITGSYAVETVISMHEVDAFEDAVAAYPAVVVLRNTRQQAASVVEARSTFGCSDTKRLLSWIGQSEERQSTTHRFVANKVDHWFTGRELWPTGTPAQLALISELEARCPSLEDRRTGTRVGIGVATGCDEVFVTNDPELVETERLMPLLLAGDTASGAPTWSGTYLVNPWDEDGLVELSRYPRLRAYLGAHEGRLRDRHVARRRPEQWYRTIDRVHPSLTARPKIVLPDLKAAAHPVLETGTSYPHHNLYYVLSDAWDPHALGGLLLSQVANLFVGAYCVRMRGGCFRFQAQYIRKIRVPHIDTVTRSDQAALARAFEDRDVAGATTVAAPLYGLDPEVLAQVTGR